MSHKDISSFYPKVGVITYPYLGERQVRQESYEEAILAHKRLLEQLTQLELNVLAVPRPVKSEEDALLQGDRLLKQGLNLLIANVPIFTHTSAVVRNAIQLKVPFIVYGSLPGVISCGSALRQINHPHIRVCKDTEKDKGLTKILSYSRASFARAKFANQVYGVFGGRPLGMYSTVIDPNQVASIFGVDVQHLDQGEIIKRGDKIEPSRVGKYLNWLRAVCGGIVSDLTRKEEDDILTISIKSYLATKELVKDYGFDFIGVKCQPPCSIHGYVTQCLAASTFPDPYDGEGNKEPIVYSCEADGDGALTMQILKLISGGKPILFADICRRFPDGIFSLKNCGGMATYYAGRSKDPKKNMKNVYLGIWKMKTVEKCVSVTYIAAPGEMTFARLYRDEERRYKMAIIKGEFVKYPKVKLKKGTYEYLQAFTRLDIGNFDSMISELGSHHIHGVEGDYAQELKYICRLYGIEPVIF